MPRMSKWLGDTMDAVFKNMYHPVQVTNTLNLSNGLKKVRFEGDLSKTKFTAGNVVEFRVTPTDYRHYTPSYFNSEKGICEIIFYLHNKGVGSDWANQLQTGDKVKLLGPGGKISYQHSFNSHLVFGDETSLGLMVCMREEARKNKHHFFTIAETAPAHTKWIDDFFPGYARTVESSFSSPASPAIQYLEDEGFAISINIKHTCFYLTGRAKSIQAMRAWLLSKNVSMKQIKTEPYWAEGKKGL
ncbi:MAG: siderophore-interacting protein [Niabella sp.]